MSNTICACQTGMQNSGLPICVQTQKVLKKFIFVNLQTAAGVNNFLDPSTTLNAAAMTALINNADTSIRYYVTPEIKNVTADKEDPVYEKFKDGSSFFIREGVRTFKGVFPDCPPLYKGVLESMRCNSNLGFYGIDIQGNIFGLTNGTDGKLYPIPVNVQSVVAKVMLGTDDTTQQIDFSYEIPSWVLDSNFRMIGRNSFVDYNPVTLNGLLSVYFSLVSITDTVLTVNIYLQSPDLGALVPLQGLVTANFISSNTAATGKIYDVTDAADKTITAAAVAGTPGQYTLTYSTIAAKTLTLDASLSGYDFSWFISTLAPALVTP